MTMLLLELGRFPSIFCAIMLFQGTPSLYADPLILEGRLGASSGAAFSPALTCAQRPFRLAGREQREIRVILFSYWL